MLSPDGHTCARREDGAVNDVVARVEPLSSASDYFN